MSIHRNARKLVIVVCGMEVMHKKEGNDKRTKNYLIWSKSLTSNRCDYQTSNWEL